MRLNAPETHLPSDKIETFFLETAQGEKRCVHFKLWKNLLLRGSRKFKGYLNPITLLQFQVVDAQTGEALFQNSLWIVLIGSRRHEISPEMSLRVMRSVMTWNTFFALVKTACSWINFRPLR